MILSERKKRILIKKEDISCKIKELGEKISQDYSEKSLLIVSLLKGSFIFTADLVREINIPVQIEFMTTSSYGNEEESSGKVNILSDLKADVRDRDVLIVDDIMDSGLTMDSIIKHLNKLGPKSIKSCVFLDKPDRRRVDLKPDYVGFTIPDVFIVGYGLNYGDYFRNIPYIFTFDE